MPGQRPAQMELGESYLAHCRSILKAQTMPPCLPCWNGTDFQKEKYLKPPLNGEKRICYSMTGKAAGADATGMQTSAVLDGDEWVLNGENGLARQPRC